MFKIITFHPELMCVARLISFSAEMKRAEQEKEAAKAVEPTVEERDPFARQSDPEAQRTEIPKTDIPQTSQEAT